VNKKTTMRLFCLRLLTVTALGAYLGGCAKPDLIPNTKVIDTPKNREIISVIEKYRQAMEDRDASGVLALVHPAYRDHCGTPEGSDDLDYNALKNLLAKQFKKTSKIRYRIEYQDIQLTDTDAQVDTYIDATFVYNEPKENPRWRRLTDFNRFHLVKDGELWLFMSGL
jgi:hypothetical protein